MSGENRRTPVIVENEGECRNTLRAIMEILPMGITIADAPDATIRTISGYGRLLLEKSGGEFPGIGLPDTNSKSGIWRADGTPASPEEFPLTRAVKKGEVVKNEEWIFGRKDGTAVPMLCSAAPVLDDEGHITGGVAGWQDFTEQRRMREALRESEERFRTVFNNAAMGIVEYDDSHRFVMVNDYACRILGYDREELLGKRVLQITAAEDKELTVRTNEMIHSGRYDSFNYDTRYVRGDGTAIWANVTLSAIRDREGRPILTVGTIEDVSNKKRAELALRQSEEALKQSESRLKILNENLEATIVQRTQQVRSLFAALTSAEQRERRRFSAMLHDTLQQKLLGARMLLNEHLSDHAAAGAGADYEDLDDGITLINKAIQTTRVLALELDPPILRSEGLDAALRWLSSHMEKNYGLHVALETRGPVDKIKGDVQTLLTQMTRELLQNVAMHSGVFEASLEARFGSDGITIAVEDGGKGFDSESLAKMPEDETKFGLFGIKEKLDLFGGRLTIESRIGHGAKCTIFYPYKVR
jgi:PAS domain S-box-containing protein